MYKDSYALTFAECVENHAGMQMIGKPIDTGLGSDEFDTCIKFCKEYNLEYELINLLELLPEDAKQAIIEKEDDLPFAKVIVIKNGINGILGEGFAEKMYEEQKKQPYDTKAWMRGQVKNKLKRYNNCYADFDQEPDYENKKGTVINFDRVSHLKEFREILPHLFGNAAEDLFAEMNYYYDLEKTCITEHGDTERKIVICARLGAPFPLYYQWYHRFKQVGERLKINIEGGDIYAMSFKATGNDWKCSSKYTLRHAAAAKEKLIEKKIKKVAKKVVKKEKGVEKKDEVAKKKGVEKKRVVKKKEGAEKEFEKKEDGVEKKVKKVIRVVAKKEENK